MQVYFLKEIKMYNGYILEEDKEHLWHHSAFYT